MIGRGTEELIPLWVADTDFLAPSQVKEALTSAVEHGVFGYAHPPVDLFENVALWQKNRHGFNIEPSCISTIPGVTSGLSVAIQAFTEKGDKVLCNTPIYAPFHRTIRINERILAEAPLKLIEGDSPKYEIDFDELEEAIKCVKLWLFCNPHNPTTRCFSREELLKIAQICIKHNVIIVSDEIHSDVVFSGYKHIPLASLSKEISDLTITLTSPSKAFSLAGFSTSFALIENETLRERFIEFTKRNNLHVSSLGQIAASNAYKYGGEYVDSVTAYLEGNKDFALDYIKNNLPEIKAVVPEATYLLWLECSGLGFTPEGLLEFFKKSGVLLSDGLQYLEPTGQFVRLNFGCTREILTAGLDRIKTALA